MKKYYGLTIRNTVILCILACTISCYGKKDAKNAEEAQINKPLIIERTEVIDFGLDWLICVDYVNRLQSITENSYQVNSENKSISRIFKDIFSLYNLRLDDELADLWEYYEQDWKERNEIYSIVDTKYSILKNVQYGRIPFVERNSDLTPIVFFANYKSLKTEERNSIYLLIFYEKNGLVLNHSYSEWQHIENSYNYIPIRNAQYNIEYDWIKDMQVSLL